MIHNVLKTVCSDFFLCVFGGSGLPCSVDKVVCVWPVGQQVGCLHVVHSDVHVSEGFWEKVVNLPRDIQNVADARRQTKGQTQGRALTQQNSAHGSELHIVRQWKHTDG